MLGPIEWRCLPPKCLLTMRERWRPNLHFGYVNRRKNNGTATFFERLYLSLIYNDFSYKEGSYLFNDRFVELCFPKWYKIGLRETYWKLVWLAFCDNIKFITDLTSTTCFKLVFVLQKNHDSQWETFGDTLQQTHFM